MRPLSLLATVALLAAGCAKHEAPDHGAAAETHQDGYGVISATAPVALPTEAEIAGLFDQWNYTLQTGSPHDMAMLYAEDGVLLPTVSNAVRNNRPEVTDYFEHFLRLNPRGMINEQNIHVLDSNTAVNSGVYTFDVVREGQPDFVVARYSFIYEKIGGRWLIKSHHSSAMPEPVAGRPPSLAERMGARVRLAAAETDAHERAPNGTRLRTAPAPAAEAHADPAEHH